MHAARHLGSFDIAVAVGFLFAAWRPARIPGLLPVVAALVACLVASSLLDVAAGNTGALGEAHHATDFAGLAVLWLLGRGVAHTRGDAAAGARVKGKRLLALAALVVALIVAGAAPAFAHATLLTTDPQPGGKFDTSPREISLRFNEPVEVSLGGIRLYDARERRIDVGEPEHPNGQGNQVAASMPKVDDGTYVVTWRVTSADAHPVQGAFTFQVGAAGSVKNADALAKRLLASQGGSTTVGVVYAIDRVALFATLALLIGGIVFLSVIFPAGRDSRRAQRIVWGGWIGVVVATIAGIALEGIYASALPLTKVFDPTVFGEVLDTRYGRVSLVRLALLVLLLPLLRILLSRHPASEHPLRTWWLASAGVLAVGLSLTPGLAGHAGTGIYTGFAIPADAIHVLAMACWLGGLVMLLTVVLPRTDPAELRQGINRYSALALGSIVALVVTGGFQAWRQVGSFNALRDTDYGKLLIAKLVVFAALDRRRRVQPRGRESAVPDAARRRAARRPRSRARRRKRSCPCRWGSVGARARRRPPGRWRARRARCRRATGARAATATSTTTTTTTSGTRTTTRQKCDGSAVP